MKPILLFVFIAFTNSLCLSQPHHILKDIIPGPWSSINEAINTSWQDKFYFVVSNQSYSNSIWSTDGTTENTLQVTDFEETYSIKSLVSTRDYLFYDGWDGVDYHLYSLSQTDNNPKILLSHSTNFITNLYSLRDSVLIVCTKNPYDDTESIYVSDGTTTGTLILGDYELYNSVMRYSAYENKVLIIDNVQLNFWFPVIITDGSQEGTMLLEEYINIKTGESLPKIISASAEGQYILFSTEDLNDYVFNGSSLINLNIPGIINYAYRINDFWVIFSSLGVYSSDAEFTQLIDLQIRSSREIQPEKHHEKIFFYDEFEKFYMTDGTLNGTQRIEEDFFEYNTDPFIFPMDSSIYYTVQYISKIDFWKYNILSKQNTFFASTGLESIFMENIIFGNENYIVYKKLVSNYGAEYWAFNTISTSIHPVANKKAGVIIFPNPAQSEIFLFLNHQVTGDASLQIFDERGILMNMHSIEMNLQRFSVQSLVPGQYFLHLVSKEKAIQIGFFIKQ